jgi:phosphoglucosamine mutase
MAVDRLEQGGTVPGVVGTLMTNLGVERALRERGLDVVRAQVGDRYVLEELLARGWQLGGEGSGHLLSLDRHTTGDGIVSALMVLQAAVRSGRSLAALLDGVRLYPQTLVNVRLKPGSDWQASPQLAARRAQVDRELGAAGRVLIRASGTEPVLRIMVEAADAALAERSAKALAASLDA